MFIFLFMRNIFSLFLLFSFIIQSGIFFPVAKAATEDSSWSVPLQVHNPLSIERAQEPVTNGFPLPVSLGIKEVSDLRLLNAQNKIIPAQFSVTARWGGAPEDV